VYVTPEYRRRGVARALMESLIARARRDPSLEQILLAVTTANDAASGLYRSLGFTTYGTEPRARRIGSTYIDERMMILRFS
jgi:ribosomal protein S18 acetylase RimI-like enzyme